MCGFDTPKGVQFQTSSAVACVVFLSVEIR